MDDVATQPTVSLGGLPVGAQLAERYEVRAWLGEGGMGTVYRVIDRELDEEVALKLLRAEISKTPEALVRFRREVKLARKISHPNVARTFDLGVHAGQRFLTMELITGGSLSAHVKSGLPLPEILRVAAAVSSGLAASHAAGIVHRDLKPDNIMLAGERVVITDFGIARPLASDDALATSGSIVGTPAYMAPEQLGSGAIDGRADVYALGVVLFELLTRSLPFRGDSAFAIAAARLTSDVPEVRALAPEVPEGVALLVRAALARRREDRPDAQTFLQRIDALRGGRRELTSPEAPSGGGRTTLLSLGALPESTSFVRIAAFDAESAHATLAGDLVRAVTDTLTAERDVKLAGPGRAPDLTVEGELRVAGSRARVRLRLLDAASAPVWADRIEGDPADPFALEDAAAARVRDAIRQRVGRAGGPPAGPRRARWEAARDHYERFDLGNLRAAAAILEEQHAEEPADPWAMSLLASVLLRMWSQTGGTDDRAVARAEELALRALDADRSIPDAYHALGVIRLIAGDLRAGIHATQQALARAPRHAEAHHVLAQLSADSGHVQEALQRYDVALRLSPRMAVAHLQRIRTLALAGHRARAEEALARADALVGRLATVVLRTRLAIWWEDRALAARSAEILETSTSGAAWEQMLPMMQAYARGEPPVTDETRFEETTSLRVGAFHKALMYEIAAEFYCASGLHEAGLRQLTAAAQLGNFINLLWLDRCPSLSAVRHDPRFAEARALVAARAATLWD